MSSPLAPAGAPLAEGPTAGRPSIQVPPIQDPSAGGASADEPSADEPPTDDPSDDAAIDDVASADPASDDRSTGEPDVLTPREAYRSWAPSYDAETALSFLDDRVVAALTPPVAGLRVLDAGCGTGRRLRALRGAALLAGADLTPEMLAAGRAAAGGSFPAVLAAADVRALPFADAAFDLVWCRLVIGHVPSPGDVYRELARVCRPGGMVIVTDFHPQAALAGQTRTFRDGAGRLHAIEHHVHLPDDHLRKAGAAGLKLVHRRDGVVNAAMLPFYRDAGKLALFAKNEGTPVILALAFRRLRPGG